MVIHNLDFPIFTSQFFSSIEISCEASLRELRNLNNWTKISELVLMLHLLYINTENRYTFFNLIL